MEAAVADALSFKSLIRSSVVPKLQRASGHARSVSIKAMFRSR